MHDRIAEGRHRLVAAGLDPAAAAIDADVLARHVLGWDRARLLTRGRDPEPEDFAGPFLELIERRARREPVALIVGHREFWGLDFEVTRDTLVPRPETELIVEEACRVLGSHPTTVVDVGTGSGCLAVAIAVERPAARVYATDISRAALLVARRNASRHGVSARVHLVQADLARGLSVEADLVVANPPYVPETAARSLAPDVIRHEPETALFGGHDGLRLLERVLAELGAALAPGASLIVEFGDGQEDAVLDLAARHGWRVLHVLQDLQGIARTAVLRRDRG